MSLYSQGVKTRDIDLSVYLENQQASFKFAPGVYYSNLRLINVGCEGGDAVPFNRIGGVYSIIKHIRLTSDGMEIDAMRFANQYLAFKNYNQTNNDNISVNSRENKNSLGFEYQDDNKLGSSYIKTNNTVGASTEDKKGILDLRACLPSLENMDVLDTRNVFKNLELHIEFQTGPAVNNNTNTATSFTNTIRPVLLVDEIVDEDLAKKEASAFNGFTWSKIEHDVVAVPAIPNPGGGNITPQVINATLDAFDDKYLGRVLLQKVNASPTSDQGGLYSGFLGSMAVHEESFNLRVNGTKVLPTDVTQQATKTALLTDAYGSLNLIPYGDRPAIGNHPGFEDQNVNLNGVPVLEGNKQGALVGNMSWLGLALNSRVNKLQLDYGRTASNNTSSLGKPCSDPMNIHVFAEVSKAMQVNKGGGFTIVYV